jgi:hypothetical protein
MLKNDGGQYFLDEAIPTPPRVRTLLLVVSRGEQAETTGGVRLM